MQKYLRVFLITINEYFAYRLNFILWRLRVFISLLVVFFLWNSVFDKNTQFAHYQKSALLSYIIFANFLGNFVLGTRTSDIAAEINDGTIINYLLKPISFFKFYFTRDLADKILNLFFAIFEVAAIVFLFNVTLVMPKQPLLFLIFFINGTLISFYISLMLSFIGFWTTEVWAPRFLFLTSVFFLSGSYFPLDILPRPIYQTLLLTPFPYLFYLPTTFLLGKIDQFFLLAVFSSFFWVLLTAKFADWLWMRGNKSFSFWGR